MWVIVCDIAAGAWRSVQEEADRYAIGGDFAEGAYVTHDSKGLVPVEMDPERQVDAELARRFAPAPFAAAIAGARSMAQLGKAGSCLNHVCSGAGAVRYWLRPRRRGGMVFLRARG
jgi:hypothetical protein